MRCRSLLPTVPAALYLVAACSFLHAEELPLGEPAPDFTATAQDGSEVSLRDWRGQNVVLAFARAHW